MVVLGQVTVPPVMLIRGEAASAERAAPQLPQPWAAGAALTHRCAQTPARDAPPAPHHSMSLPPQAVHSPHPTPSPGHPPCFAAPPGTHPSACPPSPVCSHSRMWQDPRNSLGNLLKAAAPPADPAPEPPASPSLPSTAMQQPLPGLRVPCHRLPAAPLPLPAPPGLLPHPPVRPKLQHDAGTLRAQRRLPAPAMAAVGTASPVPPAATLRGDGTCHGDSSPARAGGCRRWAKGLAVLSQVSRPPEPCASGIGAAGGSSGGAAVGSGAAGGWRVPVCGSQPASDGDKRLALASPRRGEAKGSAARAAAPSPGAEPGSSWRQ